MDAPLGPLFSEAAFFDSAGRCSYAGCVVIVFDEAKRRSNLDKHGLDMADFAEKFDFESAVEFEAYSSRTGRSRFSLVGVFDGTLVVAIVSPLGSEALSLVSLRPAKPSERERHGFR